MELFLKNFINDVGVSEVKSLTFRRRFLINLRIETQNFSSWPRQKCIHCYRRSFALTNSTLFLIRRFVCISLFFFLFPLSTRKCAPCGMCFAWKSLSDTIFNLPSHIHSIHLPFTLTYLARLSSKYTQTHESCARGWVACSCTIRCCKDHKHELFVTHPWFAGWDVETFCKREEWAQKIDRKHI